MPGEGFKALADPTRRRILELLREGNCTAGELAEHFDISKPSLSHHLATLKNAGLVTDERHETPQFSESPACRRPHPCGLRAE